MRRVLFFSAIVALFAVSSCKKADPPFIKVEMEKIEIPTEGQNVSIPVSSNFEWQAKSDQFWAKAKRNAENNAVELYVSKNSLTDDRTAKVTLCSENADMPVATVIVTQRQKNAIAVDGSGSFDVSADEQTLQIPLKSNVGFTAEIPSDASSWLSVLPSTKGMQPVICNIAVKANESLSERSANISFKAAECSDISVSIIQQGRPQLISFTYDQAGQFTVPVLSTEDPEVKIMWAGQAKTYYGSMKIDATSAPTTVQIQGHLIKEVEFRDIVGLSAVDFTKLY